MGLRDWINKNAEYQKLTSFKVSILSKMKRLH